MSDSSLRRQIASEAARMLYRRHESQYHQAKMKAARRITRGAWVKPADLPSNAEICDELQSMTGQFGAAGLEPPKADAQSPPPGAGTQRFGVYELLLMPLQHVKGGAKHPEGDMLYHSLQVFDLARDELPYDEEFLLAALLHDVGKAIAARDHIAAGLEALDGHITNRTAWLIEHHTDAMRYRDGTLGARARRRLEASPDFETLMLLADCDRAGRVRGVEVPELEEALEYVRQLEEEEEQEGGGEGQWDD